MAPRFHTASRKIVLPSGEWVAPELLGVLDDRSRLCCHLQWYLVENAENLIHGLNQAIQKRGLFRSLLTDNGGAMLAGETREGLARLGIEHATTLPACPEQNGKQESFWGQVEGRLLAMLENVPDLTLDALNHATQAWVEMEYNRAVHSEIGETPAERFLRGPHVGRDSPSADDLRNAFRVEEVRTQRRSDGTVSIAGVRFEVPSRYRHMEQLSFATRAGTSGASTSSIREPARCSRRFVRSPAQRTRRESVASSARSPIRTPHLRRRPECHRFCANSSRRTTAAVCHRRTCRRPRPPATNQPTRRTPDGYAQALGSLRSQVESVSVGSSRGARQSWSPDTRGSHR